MRSTNTNIRYMWLYSWLSDMYRFMFIEGAILVFDCFGPPRLQKYFYERQEISNAVHYVPACVCLWGRALA
jgi:hypothetical protein